MYNNVICIRYRIFRGKCLVYTISKMSSGIQHAPQTRIIGVFMTIIGLTWVVHRRVRYRVSFLPMPLSSRYELFR